MSDIKLDLDTRDYKHKDESHLEHWAYKQMRAAGIPVKGDVVEKHFKILGVEHGVMKWEKSPVYPWIVNVTWCDNAASLLAKP